MNRLEQLPDIANRQLGGLTADERLYAKIRIAAETPRHKPHLRLRPVLVGALATALCLGIVFLTVPAFLPTENTRLEMSSGVAGKGMGSGSSATLQALDVPSGSISVGSSSSASGTYRNLFATQKSGAYPMIIVDNAVYRLLISPTNMDSALLGDSLGEVTEYTVEPALSNSGIISNAVSAGSTVYAVQGMKGAMAAAYINGALRVFQRVSYAGDALLGSETLMDTLVGSHSVTAMELTDVGIVSDASTAQALLNTLAGNAQYQSATFASDDSRSLLIALDNGLLVQLMIGDDTVSACGTWSCPEFFDDYAAAVS
ncbi:MAG: hypothetical protein PHO41_10270 [Eubacteriales bacterium]|nr:hypothetical protein [Eubacteriales bacterium]